MGRLAVDGGASSRAVREHNAILESTQSIGRRVNMRCCPAGQLGDQLAGGRGHRKAQHVVAGGNIDVVIGWSCGR